MAQPTTPTKATPAPKSSLEWTQAYATGLESQTDLVLKGQPLTATLTRIELAQWLAQFFQYVPDRSRAQPMTDLETNSPDYWTAQAVIQSGVMRLYEGNQFRPKGNLTRLETLAILVRALQLPTPTPPEITSWMALYSDAAQVPEIGRTFIAMAGKAGLLVNVPDPKLLSPNLVLRRGEGAVLLHQALVYRRQIRPLNPPLAQLSPIAPGPTPVAVAPQAPAAPTGIPPSGVTTNKPEITATRIQPESGVLQPGSPLTIEFQGTPGGQASVDIDQKVQIPMPEVQPGIYRATYTVTASDAFLSPAISIQLVAKGSSTRVQRQLPQLVMGNAAPPSLTGPSTVTPIIPTPVGVAPAPNPGSLFSGVRIRPERDLQQGDILTINLWGVSGGVAQFDLGNLAKNQPMREISPNLYEGTFVVSPADRENNPSLSIVLTVNGRSDQYQQIQPFRIDGSRGTSGIPTPLPFTPPGSLNPVGNPPLNSNPTPPQVFQVNANTANRQLRANDLLEVSLRGDPSSQASFLIVGVTPAIPMQEISPGYYEGRVRIPTPVPLVTNGILQFNLERNGQRSVQTLKDPVNIVP